MARERARIAAVDVAAYTTPTDRPESDGTLAWDATTLVRVEVAAGGVRGWGWTYADRATAQLASLHAPIACAASRLIHVEWFHDHVRIERDLLDGFVSPTHGAIRPDRTRPGHGYDFKTKDAEQFR